MIKSSKNLAVRMCIK